jgi:oligopeptide transport system substrate-binding protein
MKKTAMFIAATLLAVTGLFTGCQGGMGGKGAEFIIGNGSEPQSLDPSKIEGIPEQRINIALFEGLVGYDAKTATAVPGVAESWTISPDGTVYTFKLRKTTWSDGTPITAKTFVDSWLRTLDPATASNYAYMIGMVVKGANDFNTGTGPKENVAIKAVDDYTFEVTLNGPSPYALDMMAHQSFNPLPMHAIEKFGADWIKPGNFVGNGPFVLETWTPQEKITAIPNPKYWDKKNVHLARITFLPIDDNNTAYAKFKAGEMDWNANPPLSMLDEVKLREDYQVSPQVATYYYIFNVTKGPLQDVRVRKALTMAINKQELVDKVTKAGQLPADSLVPTMAGYTPATGTAFNADEAKKLLAEAGYPNGKGFPKLTVIYNTSEAHKTVAEYIQQVWKTTLGVDIQIKNVEWKTFLDQRHNHDFEISRAGWVGDYQDPNTYTEMFITGGGNNDGAYANPKYDELVRKAATLPGGAERMQVLHDAEDILITQDQAVLPLYFYVDQHLIDTTKWTGWYPNALGIHTYKGIAKAK